MADDIYHIRVRGHLDESWSEWLGDMKLVQSPDGTTSLTGPLPDQAALHGLLNRLFSLGLQLLSVCCLTQHAVDMQAQDRIPKGNRSSMGREP